MRILLLHNRYQLLGGEDVVFDVERKLLESKGHKVISYERNNNEIKGYSTLNKLILAVQTIWSVESYRQIRTLIKNTKPDIAHFHNVFPLISPSAYYACKDEGIPVVQTLHNYRIFCAGAKLLRDGSICERCINSRIWRGVFHGCYHKSKIQTLPVVGMQWIHNLFKTWSQKVDIFIALTQFAKTKFVQGSLSQENIIVKSNFFAHTIEPSFAHNDFVIFIGRLDESKGVVSLLEAWMDMRDVPLKIVGDGPARNELEAKKRRHGLDSVEFCGQLSLEKCIDLLKLARFMVIPSLWFEMFPMVITEAFASGKAVLASNLGSMAELVVDGKTGCLFNPGDPKDLSKMARWMIENDNKVTEMGKNARAEFEAKYTAERNYSILMTIYDKAMQKNM